MNNKICVYTCVTGDYDNVKEFSKLKEKNIDYYLFTNNKNIKSDFWNVVYIENEGLDNIRLARKIKTVGHDIINNNYDISVWMDGAIVPRMKISEFIKECCDFKKYDLVGFKHQVRNCIYEEFLACIRHKKENKDVIKKQREFLKKEKYPINNGLIESTVFVRNLKSEKVKETCNMWFDMILNYSYRDQLSFNYVAYKTGLKFDLIDLNVFDNKYFVSQGHIIKKEISKYRAYFGDDSVIKNIDIDLDIQGKYIIDDDKYVAEIISPTDIDYMNFDICNMGGILLKSIKINNKNVNYEFINGFKYNDKSYFFNYNPAIRIKRKFKKDENLKIELEVDMLTEKDIFNIINSIYNMCNEKDQMISVLNHQVNILNAQNEQLINSTSFKITKPIRAIGKIIRGKK